jgi:hypothetical protein
MILVTQDSYLETLKYHLTIHNRRSHCFVGHIRVPTIPLHSYTVSGQTINSETACHPKFNAPYLPENITRIFFLFLICNIRGCLVTEHNVKKFCACISPKPEGGGGEGGHLTFW